MRRLRRKLGAWAWAGLGPSSFKGLASTWRIQTAGEEHLELRPGDPPGHILALWHGRMILGLPHHGHLNKHVLVSMSGDGDLARLLLQHYGYHVIRGSSSRRGARALREMLTALDAGHDVIVTPDGPRGPRHSMNAGPGFMARETGRAIIPIGLACDRAWYLKSWDRFTIPKPRARVMIEYGAPIRLDPAADDSAIEACAERLAEGLIATETSAFKRLGVPVDW